MSDLKNGLDKRTVFHIGLPLCYSSRDSESTRGKAVNHNPKYQRSIIFENYSRINSKE